MTARVPVVTPSGPVVIRSGPVVTKQGPVVTTSLLVVIQPGRLVTTAGAVVTATGPVVTDGGPVVTKGNGGPGVIEGAPWHTGGTEPATSVAALAQAWFALSFSNNLGGFVPRSPFGASPGGSVPRGGFAPRCLPQRKPGPTRALARTPPRRGSNIFLRKESFCPRKKALTKRTATTP